MPSARGPPRPILRRRRRLRGAAPRGERARRDPRRPGAGRTRSRRRAARLGRSSTNRAQGRRPGLWLEPDINDRLAERCPARGDGACAIVPVGFLYRPHGGALGPRHRGDSETAGRARARRRAHADARLAPALRRGARRPRARAPRRHPAATRPALTDLGPWFGVCRPGCCESVRAGFKPAAARIAP